jgi:hypothetical protein
MQIITPFDPSAAASGSINTGLVNRCAVIYLINESAIGIKLTFADGSTGVVPPWFARAFQLAVPNAPIEWSQLYTLGSTGAPVSIVQGEGYEPNEVEWAQLSQGPLARQVNIGNTVNTTSSGSQTIVTNIINDGSVTPTQFIEASITGLPASTVSISNNGTMVLGNSTFPGSISSDNAQFHTDGSGNVTCKNLTASGTMSVTGNLSIGSLNLTHLIFSTFTVPGTATSPATVSHGLGTTPRIILCQANITGSSNTTGYKVTGITSTQCTITGVGGGTITNCIAIA